MIWNFTSPYNTNTEWFIPLSFLDSKIICYDKYHDFFLKFLNDKLDCTHLPLLDPICHEDSEGRLLPEEKGSNDDVAKYWFWIFEIICL